MQMRRHAGHAAGEDFAALSHELLQQVGIFVIDRFEGDVDPAARHGAVGPSEGRTTFWGLGLHE